MFRLDDAVGSGVPILMYHEVAEPSGFAAIDRVMHKEYIVSIEQFERHLKLFRSVGCNPVSLDALTSWMNGGPALPARAMVITFDDGYIGNHTHALPLLERFGYTATFFVSTARIGASLMMRWSEVADLARRGMTVGSHTVNHPLLSALNQEQTAFELTDSKRHIEAEVGAPSLYLSLPNGDSNRWYEACAKSAGYRAGCGSVFGLNTPRTNPFLLKRIAIKQQLADERLRAYVSRDYGVLLRAECKATLKRMAGAVIGKRAYHGLYKALRHRSAARDVDA